MPKSKEEQQEALRAELSRFFKMMADIAKDIRAKNPNLKPAQATAKAWDVPGKRDEFKAIHAKYPGIVLPRKHKEKKPKKEKHHEDKRRKV
jgi:hypothetical protein